MLDNNVTLIYKGLALIYMSFVRPKVYGFWAVLDWNSV